MVEDEGQLAEDELQCLLNSQVRACAGLHAWLQLAQRSQQLLERAAAVWVEKGACTRPVCCQELRPLQPFPSAAFFRSWLLSWPPCSGPGVTLSKSYHYTTPFLFH